MSTINLGTAAKEVVSFLASAGDFAPVAIGFIQSTVNAVEGTTKTGTDKMTAVLNATEAFVSKEVPLLLNSMEAFMAAVEAFVNVLVGIYNDLGIFIHGVEAAVGGKA